MKSEQEIRFRIERLQSDLKYAEGMENTQASTNISNGLKGAIMAYEWVLGEES